MKQLGTLDSAFINLENNNTPQHVGALGIYDPSTAPSGFVRFKDVLANFEQRLNRLPQFRTRLVQVPGDIDRPYWVEDRNFDVEFHIRHISLPKPGDWRQLWIQTARLHSRSLDLSRPLWEAYIIEGLDNIPGLPKGAFAMYTKMHHALVDGAGGADFMSALHDLEPEPGDSPRQEPDTIVVDRQPSETELLARAIINRTVNTVPMLRSISSTAIDLARYGLAIARDEVPSPDLSAPKTRFNDPVGPHRVAEAAQFELQDFKDIKNTTGSTVNDVALSVIGGAMRRYLQLYGELPKESLAAAIPLNMRTRREANDENNQVGAMFAELHTDVADPLARIRAVSQSTKAAKRATDDNPMVESLRLAGFFSPALSKYAASLWTRNHLSRFIPLNTSTVVTNVPGPNFPLYCAGAKLVRHHGLGVLTPGCGLFQTVFSSSGKITITILADRAAMPDPEVYIQCLNESFEETYKAATAADEQADTQSAKETRTKRKKAKTSKAKKAKAKTKTKTKASTKGARKAEANNTPVANKAETKTEKIAKTPKASKPVAGEAPASSSGKPRRSLRDIKIPASAKRTSSSRKSVAPRRARRPEAELETA